MRENERKRNKYMKNFKQKKFDHCVFSILKFFSCCQNKLFYFFPDYDSILKRIIMLSQNIIYGMFNLWQLFL